MPTVIERLRELPCSNPDCNTCQLCDVYPCERRALRYIPALLALADAVKAKDQAAIDKALAELEKEAT